MMNEQTKGSRENPIRTAKRIYWASPVPGTGDKLWNSYFQPCNPKNGRPWQAVRYLSDGHDCYQGGKYNEKDSAPVVAGLRPTWEESKAKGWDFCVSGFSTRELALAACRAHMVKSRLAEIACEVIPAEKVEVQS